MTDSKDPLKSFLPSDDEIEKAMREAMRDDAAASDGIPSSGPAFQALRENGPARGKVLMVDRDQVVVDLSYKAEGIITLDEFGKQPPAVGDEIEAWVMALEDANGQVTLSIREAQRRKVWDSMAEGASEGAILTGKIIEARKGGCSVDIGMRAFMPARECDIRFVEDLETLVGMDVRVKVIEADQATKNVVVSRRAVLREERESLKSELYKNLAPGQSYKGTVTNITDFGAFVDIGGAEGLVHKGDLAWGRVESVADVVALGQEVDVVVLKFDRQADKISLGLKQAGPSPWDHAELRYGAGTRHTGRVVGLLDFGAVVEFEPGIQGLIHVSEMRWGQRVNKPDEVVTLGEDVDIEVISLDMERHKLSLSIKRVEENPWSSLEQKYPFATVVHGTVSRLEEFGAFIKIDEDDVEGLCHVSEISWTERYNHPKDALSVGDQVTAIVLESDTSRQRLSLSIKNTEPDPWWDVETDFPVATSHAATIVRLTDFGAFAEVRKGCEGLIHVSNMGDFRVGHPRDVVKVGDSVTVEVMEASEEARRLGLKLLTVGDDDDGED